MAITHSMTTGKVTQKDRREVGRLAEEFFKTEEDSEQLPGHEITEEFVTVQFPYCVNVIKDGAVVIGHTFALPCDRKTMHDFLSRQINERELFYKIRDDVDPKTYAALYLGSALIIPSHQRRGIATDGFVLQVQKYQELLRRDLEIFCWELTLEGKKLATKVAERTGLPLRIHA